MSLHDEYPDNALANAIDGRVLGCPPVLCGRLSPDGSKACTRPHGHGVTAMTLPDGRRTYVDHNRERDGSGEGW